MSENYGHQSSGGVVVFIDYFNLVGSLNWPDPRQMDWKQFRKNLDSYFGNVESVNIYGPEGFEMDTSIPWTNLNELEKEYKGVVRVFDRIRQHQGFARHLGSLNAHCIRNQRDPLFKLITSPMHVRTRGTRNKHKYNCGARLDYKKGLYNHFAFADCNCGSPNTIWLDCDIDEHIIRDMLRVACQDAPPKGVVLVSGDADFADILQVMRLKGIHTTVVSSRPALSRKLCKLADSIISPVHFFQYKGLIPKRYNKRCEQRILREELQVA